MTPFPHGAHVDEPFSLPRRYFCHTENSDDGITCKPHKYAPHLNTLSRPSPTPCGQLFIHYIYVNENGVEERRVWTEATENLPFLKLSSAQDNLIPCAP